MLGLFRDFQPRFVKPYADLGRDVARAAENDCREARDGTFPAAEHGVR
jgi:3-methyl-2-oxobutanoate hydroxymethyltransferase